jgi:hypothetical protein
MISESKKKLAREFCKQLGEKLMAAPFDVTLNETIEELGLNPEGLSSLQTILHAGVVSRGWLPADSLSMFDLGWRIGLLAGYQRGVSMKSKQV